MYYDRVELGYELSLRWGAMFKDRVHFRRDEFSSEKKFAGSQVWIIFTVRFKYDACG